MSAQPNRSFGTAWIALCIALALHVADEAAHDFLSLYNPTVIAIRTRIPWFPMPEFEYRTWMTLLVIAIVVLLLLSFFAYAGSRWLRPLGYFFALSMTANGLAHIGASLYLHRFAPGVYSSPLLLLGGLYLLYSLTHTGRQHISTGGRT